MDYRVFWNLKGVKKYCQSRNISICGVEIRPGAEPIHKQPFRGETVFMLGNEALGLNQNQIDTCDHFVYIPQHTKKVASLNVAIAGSIIFHHFALWAGFEEAYFEEDAYTEEKAYDT